MGKTTLKMNCELLLERLEGRILLSADGLLFGKIQPVFDAHVSSATDQHARLRATESPIVELTSVVQKQLKDHPQTVPQVKTRLHQEQQNEMELRGANERALPIVLGQLDGLGRPVELVNSVADNLGDQDWTSVSTLEKFQNTIDDIAGDVSISLRRQFQREVLSNMETEFPLVGERAQDVTTFRIPLRDNIESRRSENQQVEKLKTKNDILSVASIVSFQQPVEKIQKLARLVTQRIKPLLSNESKIANLDVDEVNREGGIKDGKTQDCEIEDKLNIKRRSQQKLRLIKLKQSDNKTVTETKRSKDVNKESLDSIQLRKLSEQEWNGKNPAEASFALAVSFDECTENQQAVQTKSSPISPVSRQQVSASADPVPDETVPVVRSASTASQTNNSTLSEHHDQALSSLVREMSSFRTSSEANRSPSPVSETMPLVQGALFAVSLGHPLTRLGTTAEDVTGEGNYDRSSVVARTVSSRSRHRRSRLYERCLKHRSLEDEQLWEDELVLNGNRGRQFPTGILSEMSTNDQIGERSDQKNHRSPVSAIRSVLGQGIVSWIESVPENDLKTDVSSQSRDDDQVQASAIGLSTASDKVGWAAAGTAVVVMAKKILVNRFSRQKHIPAGVVTYDGPTLGVEDVS